MKENETVLSEHPVSDDMRANVKENLGALERQHQVKVLFACESGSRGWGFASPDSDYDVRFVYVHRLSWYLTVESGRDVIELPISGDLDINGWDLRKKLQLACVSNPTTARVAALAYRLPAGIPMGRTSSGSGGGKLFTGARLSPLCVDGQEEPAGASVR